MSRAALFSLALVAAAAGSARGQATARPNAPSTAPAAGQTPATPAQTAPAAMPGVQAPTDGSVPGPQIIGWIRPGQSRDGRLEVGDYRMGDGTLADVWYVDVTAPRRHAIGVSSQDFEVYLQILDPYGAKLSESPPRGGRDATVIFEFPATGRYQIVVNSAGSEQRTGSYRLNLK